MRNSLHSPAEGHDEMAPLNPKESGAAMAVSSPSSSVIGKLAVAMIFVAAIAAFFVFDLGQYVSLDTIKSNRDKLLAYTDAHYATAVAIFVGLYCLQTAFSIPGATIFTLTSGFLFGSVAGTLYANLGGTSGATIAFLASRYLLHDWVEAKFGQRLRPLQEGFSKNAWSYLLTLRLIPIFPFFVINLACGLTRISLRTYVGATAIGIIPASFIYAYAGRQLGTINSLREIASPQVLLAFTMLGLLAIVPIVYRKVTRRSVNS